VREGDVPPIDGYVGSGGPPLSGVAIAQVIANRDETNQGRVQLSLPWLPNLRPWARVASCSAGHRRGIYFIPQVGDEVLVAFQHGDVRDPYVLGSLWNAQDLPPGTGALDPVEKRFIRTPAGHVIEFDDKARSITVQTCDGQTILLDPDKIEITTGDGSTTVRLENGGTVTIKADAKIELSAETITLDATTLELKSSASATLDGGAMCAVKGSMVTIN
jgi:uncharacterized protein involved in type VI secretion and phage assembly